MRKKGHINNIMQKSNEEEEVKLVMESNEE